MLGSVLVALLGVAANIVDDGAAGWLWALFGHWQRVHVDTRPTAGSAEAKRVVACLVAVAAYVWQEQADYRFPPVALGAVVLGVGVLTLCLFLFRRGPSRDQPPEAMARALRFTGRHTLEIHALQLGLFEIIVKLFPGLAA